MNVVHHLVRLHPDSDVTRVNCGVASPVHLAPDVHRNHPGNHRGLVLERGADRLGQMLQQKGVYRDLRLPANMPDLSGDSIVKQMPGHRRRRLRAVAWTGPLFQGAPLHATTRTQVFRQCAQQRKPGRGDRVLDLSQRFHLRASAPENLRQAADPVEFGVRQKYPLGFRRAGRKAPEANPDELPQFFHCDEPGSYRVNHVSAHNIDSFPLRSRAAI